VSHSDLGQGFHGLSQIATHKLCQQVFETHRWSHREKGAMYPLSLSVDPLTAQGKPIMTRIAPCVIAALALGVSACTNPYDPVERGLGGGIWGAASGISGAATARSRRCCRNE
jgi:hypothetical protein